MGVVKENGSDQNSPPPVVSWLHVSLWVCMLCPLWFIEVHKIISSVSLSMPHCPTTMSWLPRRLGTRRERLSGCKLNSLKNWKKRTWESQWVFSISISIFPLANVTRLVHSSCLCFLSENRRWRSRPSTGFKGRRTIFEKYRYLLKVSDACNWSSGQSNVPLSTRWNMLLLLFLAFQTIR